jgi:hypothetical protein
MCQQFVFNTKSDALRFMAREISNYYTMRLAKVGPIFIVYAEERG